MPVLRVGTSGYAYKEWLGSFYPAKFPQSKMLSYYAERFSTVEINYTFYHLPTLKTTEAWIPQTPDNFVFTLKGNKNVTHIRRLRGAGELVQAFVDGAAPLANAGKLGCIFWQLPPQLKIDLPLLDEFLSSLPTGPVFHWVMEFRHASWFADGTYVLLRKYNTAMCVADTDEGCVPDEATANFCYYRLRKIDYSDEEMDAWRQKFAERLAEGRDVYTYFKHEEEGTGPAFAFRLLGRAQA